MHPDPGEDGDVTLKTELPPAVIVLGDAEIVTGVWHPPVTVTVVVRQAVLPPEPSALT